MKDLLLNEEELEIVYQNSYRFNYGDFYIEYLIEDNEWVAVHTDEEQFSEQIVLTNMENDVILFSEYEFTLKEFAMLRDFVEKDTNIIK